MTKEQCKEYCNQKSIEFTEEGDKIIIDCGYDEDNWWIDGPYHMTEEIYDFSPNNQKFKTTGNMIYDYEDIAILRVLGYHRNEIEEIIGEEV